MELARWLGSVCALIALTACRDDGIGSACTPTVPCDTDGTSCGFHAAETYVLKDAPGCPDRQACLVYKLDNGTDGRLPADPRVPCISPGSPEGCVTEEAIDRSIYCTCPCAREGSSDRTGLCSCGDGYECSKAGGGPEWYCAKMPR